jgi:hypothetical protein
MHFFNGIPDVCESAQVGELRRNHEPGQPGRGRVAAEGVHRYATVRIT